MIITIATVVISAGSESEINRIEEGLRRYDTEHGEGSCVGTSRSLWRLEMRLSSHSPTKRFWTLSRKMIQTLRSVSIRVATSSFSCLLSVWIHRISRSSSLLRSSNLYALSLSLRYTRF
ncbi:hypothetical protein Bca101_058314 [Brassica carinata]